MRTMKTERKLEREIRDFKNRLKAAEKAVEGLCQELERLLEPVITDLKAFPNWDKETGEMLISLYSNSHNTDNPCSGKTLEKIVVGCIPSLKFRIGWPDCVSLRDEEIPEVQQWLKLVDWKKVRQFEIAALRFEEAARVLCEHLTELLQPIIPDIKCQGWGDKIEFFSESHCSTSILLDLDWDKYSFERVLVEIMPELQEHIAFPSQVFLRDEEICQIETLLREE